VSEKPAREDSLDDGHRLNDAIFDRFELLVEQSRELRRSAEFGQVFGRSSPNAPVIEPSPASSDLLEDLRNVACAVWIWLGVMDDFRNWHVRAA
jgi:hypothetical protein